jgi:hypothetical protein
MRPGPDPLNTEALAPAPKPKKRRKVAKPSYLRVVLELGVVILALALVVAFLPLSSPYFPWVCGTASMVTSGYALFGLSRWKDSAAWWGFVWGGRDEDELAKGLLYTILLFLGALIPVGVVKCLVKTPAVLHPVAYLFWCIIQDYLFFCLILRGLERLLEGNLVGHRHLAILITAGLFGLSHFPLVGFMGITAVIAIFWGYLFFQMRLIWPLTGLHFLLGFLVMS